MRTNRLGRWLIGGALIAAGVVAAHAGQAGADGRDQMLACESSSQSDSADQAASQSNEQSLQAEGFDWD